MSTLRAASVTLAAGLLLLASACAATAPEESFGDWTTRMDRELGDGYGSGLSGPGSVPFGPAEVPGDFRVEAVCRGADAMTLDLSSEAGELGTIDLQCGASSSTTITLSAGELLVESESAADFYVMVSVIS